LKFLDSPNELKKKRDEYNRSIRNEKKKEILKAKRSNNLQAFFLSQRNAIKLPSFYSLDTDQQFMLFQHCHQKTLTQVNVNKLFPSIDSYNKIHQHLGMTGLHGALSQEHIFPTESIIEANMTPKLVQFLKNDKEPYLQVKMFP